MSTVKKKTNKCIAWLMMLSLVIGMIGVISVPDTAQAAEKQLFTEEKSSEILNDDIHEWNAKLEDNKLTVNIADADAGIGALAGSNWVAYLIMYNSIKKVNVIAGFAEFKDTKCTVTANFNTPALQALEDGEYMAYIEVDNGTGASNYTEWTDAVYVTIQDGVPSLYTYWGKENQDFLNRLNETCNPEDYVNPALLTAISADNYVDIVNTAKKVAGNGSDETKIKKIHDWICENIAYDYELLNSTGLIKIDPVKDTFNNKRSVCSGFARLAQVMFRAAGIPCISVEGVARVDDVPYDSNGNMITNHEWNAVYYNGSWHYIDTTWDCGNTYYGEGSEKNKSGQKPSYTYYGITATHLGISHCVDPSWSSLVNTVESIEIKNAKTKYVLGEELDTNYDLYYKLRFKYTNVSGGGFDFGESTATDLYNAGKGLGTVSGYDPNKLGKQTITVDYQGFQTTYEVEVMEKPDIEGIKVVPKVTTYVQGSEFDENNEVYYIMSDKSEVLVEDAKITYSGYDMNKTGKQTVTVECNGYTTTYDITVNENQSTPKPDCKHEFTNIKNNKKATCLEEGYTGDRYCMICEEIVNKGSVIPKTDHTWNLGTITKKPTSTTEGIRTYKCKVCNITKTETIPATGSTTGGTTKPNATSKPTAAPTTANKPAATSKPTGTTTDNGTDTDTHVKGDYVTVSSGVYMVTKPSSGASEGEVAFAGAGSAKVTIPATVTVDGKTYKVTSIAAKAFYGNTTIKRVTIGSNIVKIGKAAFYKCKNLKKVTIKSTKLTTKSVGAKASKGIYKKAQFKVPKKLLKTYKKMLIKKGANKKSKFK